jgi:hypothetical protein
MVQQTVICDACRQVVIESRTRLAIDCGPAHEAGIREADLCRDCGERLLDFLRSGAPELASTLATA